MLLVMLYFSARYAKPNITLKITIQARTNLLVESLARFLFS